VRVLADENIPAASIRVLQEAGHDVDTFLGFGAGASDVDVLEHATETDRLLVTFDRDFGRLVFRDRRAAPAGVLFLRFAPREPAEAGRLVADLLARIIHGHVAHRFVSSASSSFSCGTGAERTSRSPFWARTDRRGRGTTTTAAQSEPSRRRDEEIGDLDRPEHAWS